MRFVRAMRLRHDRDYALARPPSMVAICVIVGALAALWLVPALFWFDQAGPDQRLFLCVLIAALDERGHADDGRRCRPPRSSTSR